MERFRATLGGQAGERPVVEVPFDVKAAYGKARPPVLVRVEGTELRTTVAVYGGRSYVGFNKQVRDRAGIAIGDEVEVEIELDDLPREVDVPAELEAALAADTRARERFEALSFTHRREYAEWIAEAKKDETRERRLAKTLAMLES